MKSEYITCEEVITFLLEYLSNELPPEREVEFERHLAVCPSCVAYLKTYKETIRLGQRVMGAEAAAQPPLLAPELVAAILAGRPQ